MRRLTIADELKSLLVGVVFMVCSAIAAVQLMGGSSYSSSDFDSTTQPAVVVQAGEIRWEPRAPSGN